VREERCKRVKTVTSPRDSLAGGRGEKKRKAGEIKIDIFDSSRRKRIAGKRKRGMGGMRKRGGGEKRDMTRAKRRRRTGGAITERIEGEKDRRAIKDIMYDGECGRKKGSVRGGKESRSKRETNQDI